MNVLITGGTGFIGSALTQTLLGQVCAVTILTRRPDSVPEGVKALERLEDLTPEDHFDVVINLAGEPIFGGRWTASRKKALRESRIDLTHELVSCIGRMSVKPDVLISGSAIGYYGDQGSTLLSEESEPGDDFSANLCRNWEEAALRAEQYGVRVCLIRTGLVIGENGGFLKRMLLPFFLGLGGRIGSGQQWMSWVHLNDWIAIALAMISNPVMQGAYNATASNPVTNKEFTRILAGCLHRPAFLPVPTFLLKLLLGEMSELLLSSQCVMPKRLIELGYIFQHDDLESALKLTLSAR